MDTLRLLLGYLPNIVSSLTEAVQWLLTFTIRDITTIPAIAGALLGNPAGGALWVWLETSTAPVLDVPFLAVMFGGYITTWLAFSVIRWIIGIFT